MRKLAAGLGSTLRFWSQTEIHVYSFSIAANVLLSFYPFLIVMVSVSRIFFSKETTFAAIDLALRDFFPAAFTDFIHGQGHDNLPQGGSTEIISILLLLFTANGIFQPLEVALNRIWGITKNRNIFLNQLVSLGLIFACGLLVIISLMMTAFNEASFQGRMGSGFLASSAAVISTLVFKMAALPATVMCLYLIYKFLPNGTAPNNRVIPAAIFTGLLLEVLKYINKLIWPSFFVKLTKEYGVFRYSVTLILLSFLASMLVLAGAEWSARGYRLDHALKEPAHA
jgi:membrane protein